jgi:hypothetical protein
VPSSASSSAVSPGHPLSRFSRAEPHRLVVERGVSNVSTTTIARWLREDALKPWQYRPWVLPTDPYFVLKADGVALARLAHDGFPKVASERRAENGLAGLPSICRRALLSQFGGRTTLTSGWRAPMRTTRPPAH